MLLQERAMDIDAEGRRGYRDHRLSCHRSRPPPLIPLLYRRICMSDQGGKDNEKAAVVGEMGGAGTSRVDNDFMVYHSGPLIVCYL
jgi:hypothetical protein